MARATSDFDSYSTLHRLQSHSHFPLPECYQNFICNTHTQSSPSLLSFQEPVKKQHKAARCRSFPTLTPPRKYLTYQPFLFTIPSLHSVPLLPHTQRGSFNPEPHRLLVVSIQPKRALSATCPTAEKAKAPHGRLIFRRVLVICLGMGRSPRAFSWMRRGGLM